MKYTYLKANEADKDAIFGIYTTVMKSFVERIWGWDEQWQKSEFNKFFPLTSITIVTTDSNAVAYSQLQEFRQMVFLRMLAILPAHQRKGIGTKLMEDLLQYARERNKPARLDVFKINRKVLDFYRPFGFEIVFQNSTSYTLECKT